MSFPNVEATNPTTASATAGDMTRIRPAWLTALPCMLSVNASYHVQPAAHISAVPANCPAALPQKHAVQQMAVFSVPQWTHQISSAAAMLWVTVQAIMQQCMRECLTGFSQ